MSLNDIATAMTSYNENNEVYVRKLAIDNITPIYHLGKELFTSNLCLYLYQTWDEWEVIVYKMRIPVKRPSELHRFIFVRLMVT